jgi:hypothetical protein
MVEDRKRTLVAICEVVDVVDYGLTRLRRLAERLPDPAAQAALDNNVGEHLDHLRSDIECIVHDSLQRIEDLRERVRATAPDGAEAT